MARKSSRPPLLAGTPDLIFRWRPPGTPLIPKLLNLAMVGGFFALFISAVRIQVKVPDKSAPRKASLIYLRDDEEGRSLARRALEGGPFPSRFELSEWPLLAEQEATALSAAQFQPPAYSPEVPDLPQESLARPILLAARGESFFPQRIPVKSTPPDSGNLRLAPALYPLSGITAADLPTDLPPFNPGPADKDVYKAAWRLLVKLGPAGTVTECVSLEKGSERGADALETWLHTVQFKPAPDKPQRWIALGISFTNQPADGTDAR